MSKPNQYAETSEKIKRAKAANATTITPSLKTSKIASKLKEVVASTASSTKASSKSTKEKTAKAKVPVLPKKDTRNVSGKKAFSYSNAEKLLQYLSVAHIPFNESSIAKGATGETYYKGYDDQVREIMDLVEVMAKEDLVLTAKICTYARCVHGNRTATQIAACVLAPHVSGTQFAKFFFSSWNKTTKLGGIIYRPDDMYYLKLIHEQMYKGKPLSHAMEKGFRLALENMPSFLLKKYGKKLIDIINLVHPSPARTKNDTEGILSLLIKEGKAKAETWETNQSELGNEIASAVKGGELTKAQGEELLQDGNIEIWENLIDENKMGQLALIRNLRNILKNSKLTKTLVTKITAQLENVEKTKSALLTPFHFDVAKDFISSDVEAKGSQHASAILTSLDKAFENMLPFVEEMLPGKTLVILDESGSMEFGGSFSTGTCFTRAATIATTLYKYVNADIISFDTSARHFPSTHRHLTLSAIKAKMKANGGGTNFSSAFDLLNKGEVAYDRIVVLSDNECNSSVSANTKRFLDYCKKFGTPASMHMVDIGTNGSTMLKGPNIYMHCGYTFGLFDSLVKSSINMTTELEEVGKINFL